MRLANTIALVLALAVSGSGIRAQNDYDLRTLEVKQIFAQRALEALNEPFLPRRSRRGDDLIYAQARQPSLNPITIHAIAVS